MLDQHGKNLRSECESQVANLQILCSVCALYLHIAMVMRLVAARIRHLQDLERLVKVYSKAPTGCKRSPINPESL